jgi:hypothetical protein
MGYGRLLACQPGGRGRHHVKEANEHDTNARTPGSSHPATFYFKSYVNVFGGSAPEPWSVASAPLMPWIDGGQACPVQSASENAVDKIPG